MTICSTPAGIIRRAAAATSQRASLVGNRGPLRGALLTHLHSDPTLGLPDLILMPLGIGRTEPLSFGALRARAPSANGVRSQSEMRERIGYYRRSPIAANENPMIGCIMLAEPFVWRREDWIPCPTDFKLNTVPGKGYDSEAGIGKELWDAVSERLRQSRPAILDPGTATVAAIETHGFGKPQIVLPRLGQGLFRILVTDAYSRRCAMTGESTLPVLGAVHIKPYSLVKRHEIPNDLLMRSDLHRLFDGGYLTVDPKDHRILVSKRIKQEFENGRDYYKLEGQPLREPDQSWAKPSIENLEYHAHSVFR